MSPPTSTHPLHPSIRRNGASPCPGLVAMGQSTPTTTMALDTFEQRYAGFRAELAPKEQVWFDELVCRARRHSNAINRRPTMDFERPVLLSMLLEGMRLMEDQGREMALL